MSRRYKTAFYTVLAFLFATGAVWAFFHYFAHRENEFGSYPAEKWTLTLHGLLGGATLVLIGSLLPLHVKFAWHAQRNRPNGVVIITVFALLILTGYGLYYIGDEHFRSWTSWTHLIVGLALPIFLIVHIWRGRATRNANRSQSHARRSRKVFAK